MLIPAGDVQLAVERRGAGPPLVLLHGFTGSAADFDGVVDELADRSTVVTIEHRGHGGSTNTGDAATYTFDQLVLDLAAVLDTLDLEPVHLLGHSMGGIIAMRYALAHPGRVRSLVLMDTGPGASAEGPAHAFMRAGFQLVEQGGMAAVYDAIAPYLGDGAAGDRARAVVRRNHERMDPVAFACLGEELLTHPSILDRLATIELPTTVLVGETDHLRAEADALAATIPGAVLEVVAGAGHSPQADQPEAWLGVLHRHLDRVA